MSVEQFQAFAASKWKWNEDAAIAAFHAADIDNTGALNRHEFLVLYATFRNPNSALNEMSQVVNTVKVRFLSTYYDKDQNDSLDTEGSKFQTNYSCNLFLSLR